jgi:membrane protease subunit HflK
MAWNEPGGNNRDPWGGSGNNGGGGRDPGPPDLDEVVRKLSGKFGGLFGDKRGGGNGGSSGGGGGKMSFGSSPIGFLIIGAIAVAIWLASGFYIVDEGTRGVELRFGQYNRTTMPGLRYHLPRPIEQVEVVDVSQIRAEEIGYRSGQAEARQPALRTVAREALMLTVDENIVEVKLAIQYQVSNPRHYLFNLFDADQTLRQVSESAIRAVVGDSTLDFVLTEGRAEVVARVREITQETLDDYGAGLIITNVNLQDAQPPEQVQAAFADAIRAREDEQRVINEAEAYRNEVLPVARGEAARRLEDAEGYREQVIARALGETSRFEQLQAQYTLAPDVTRERLYLETMEAVLSNTSKVFLDAESGNNLLYLPLDRLVNRSSLAGGQPLRDPSLDGSVSGSEVEPISRFRDLSRSREVR